MLSSVAGSLAAEIAAVSTVMPNLDFSALDLKKRYSTYTSPKFIICLVSFILEFSGNAHMIKIRAHATHEQWLRGQLLCQSVSSDNSCSGESVLRPAP